MLYLTVKLNKQLVDSAARQLQNPSQSQHLYVNIAGQLHTARDPSPMSPAPENRARASTDRASLALQHVCMYR